MHAQPVLREKLKASRRSRNRRTIQLNSSGMNTSSSGSSQRNRKKEALSLECSNLTQCRRPVVNLKATSTSRASSSHRSRSKRCLMATSKCLSYGPMRLPKRVPSPWLNTIINRWKSLLNWSSCKNAHNRLTKMIRRLLIRHRLKVREQVPNKWRFQRTAR